MEVLCQILQVTHPNPYDLRIPFELEAITRSRIVVM